MLSRTMTPASDLTVLRVRPPGVSFVAVGAEGGDFDDLAAEVDVGEPEAASDEPAVGEDLLELLGGGVGGDVEVLGDEPEEQVAHAAAREVGDVAFAAQAVEHLEGVGIDLFPAKAVRFAGNDVRIHRNAASRAGALVRD